MTGAVLILTRSHRYLPKTDGLNKHCQQGQGFLHLLQRGHQMISLVLEVTGEINRLTTRLRTPR